MFAYRFTIVDFRIAIRHVFSPIGNNDARQGTTRDGGNLNYPGPAAREIAGCASGYHGTTNPRRALRVYRLIAALVVTIKANIW